MEQEQKTTFKVVDRRRFDDDGTMREGVEDRVSSMPPAAAPLHVPSTPAAATPPPSATSPAARAPSGPVAAPFAQAPRPAAVPPPDAAAQPPRPTRESGGAPGMDFAHFCLSLATSAQVAMGLVPNPATRMVTKDLVAAQQTIEMLGMLQQKTKGNLTPEEAQILDEIMYALRMQFVEVSKANLAARPQAVPGR